MYKIKWFILLYYWTLLVSIHGVSSAFLEVMVYYNRIVTLDYVYLPTGNNIYLQFIYKGYKPSRRLNSSNNEKQYGTDKDKVKIVIKYRT